MGKLMKKGLLNKKKGLANKKSGDSLRDKFKKRSQNILEKTYEEREERSSMPSGKTIWNDEVMKEMEIEVYQPQTGDNYIEILPIAFDETIPYYLEVPVHYGVGINNDAFVCMIRFKKRGCYRCEKQQLRFREVPKGSKLSNDIKKLYPTDRAAYLIWDRTDELLNDKEPEYKLKVWAAPKTKIHAEIQLQVRDKKTRQTLDISELGTEEGRTISYTVVKKKGDDYPSYKGIQLLERDEPIPDEMVDKLNEFISYANEEGFDNALESILILPEYDDVKNSQLTEPENNEEEEEEKKSGKKGSSKFGKKKKEEEEETQIDEDEIEHAVTELQEQLEGMNKFQFKKWCKSHPEFKELANEDQEEAIETIIGVVFEKALEGETDYF
jgi:hypothetical protein